VTATPGQMTNREDRHDFDVHWGWAEGPVEHGMTAVVRVKNEARSLPFALPPLMRTVDRIILVDNGSDDGTPDLATELAERHGVADRFEVKSYPFSVSRCGPEHLHTPPDSVHSLAYFYNWSFSGVRTSYSLKWDGDMVLTEIGVAALRTLNWQLEPVEVVTVIPRHPLYVADDKTAYFDFDYINLEPFIFPNGPDYTYVKAFDWELRMLPPDSRWLRMQQGLQFELKWLDADEFDHWSSTDFDKSNRTLRKRREVEVVSALHEGRDLPGITRIDAPDGMHVIDYVRTIWLDRLPRPIVQVTPPEEDQGPTGEENA
jgi:glycosyltransferase involved in cell wall biosynthesis